MKILIASTPATGHLNPLLTIGRILMSEGHEIVVLSGSAFRKRVETTGAKFRPFPSGADFDLSDLDTVAPELKTMPPGLDWIRVGMDRFFVDAITAQHKGMQEILQDFPADVVIADDMFFGVLPMLLGPKAKRPAVVLCGTSILHCRRPDKAPIFLGLPPAATPAQFRDYAAVAQTFHERVDQPVSQRLNRVLQNHGVGPLSIPLFESIIEYADAYMQLAAPSFEFPRDIPASVHFVGALPILPNQAPLPPWADELDGSRKVVLVTQGTMANHDFGLLVGPTLAALADEPDLLVVVTAGGRPVDAIPGPIPGNARLASYLPFEWLLPRVDVMVTNGGYGSVNQALGHGIPLVTAGLTEDKADVNARVAWSGVGIDLATNQPAPEALRDAVRTVLDEPTHRSHAAAMAEELSEIDTRAEILRIIRLTAASRDTVGSRRGEIADPGLRAHGAV